MDHPRITHQTRAWHTYRWFGESPGTTATKLDTELTLPGKEFSGSVKGGGQVPGMYTTRD